MQLEGKRIIVTGGASGMGASAVRAFAREGAAVASLDIDDERGSTVVAEPLPAGVPTARYFHCDVTSRDDVVASFRDAVSWMVGLDGLVHAAGLETNAPAEEISDGEWDLMLDVNARGTFLTNQVAFGYLRASGGHIVNFSSGAGVRGMPGGAHYSAAKGAVLGWSRTVAVEWAPHNITVNCVVPAIWTPMYQAARDRLTPEQLDAHDARMRLQVPLGGRLGDPDLDMAPALVFLVSDAARFITAQTICVDGGHTILT